MRRRGNCSEVRESSFAEIRGKFMCTTADETGVGW